MPEGRVSDVLEVSDVFEPEKVSSVDHPSTCKNPKKKHFAGDASNSKKPWSRSALLGGLVEAVRRPLPGGEAWAWPKQGAFLQAERRLGAVVMSQQRSSHSRRGEFH